MKVTIITVTFNSAKYLEQCIQSVIGQDYPNIEYIVIDGGSSDGTLSLLKKYESNIAKWVSEPDRGIYDALNKGMAMATGDIIGLLHSDDVFASVDVISSIVAAFTEKKVDSLYGDLQYVFTDDINRLYRKWSGEQYDRKLFEKGWMPAHPTFYFKREIFLKYGGYKSHYFTAADYELMARYLYRFKISSYYLPKLIVKMRRGGQSNQGLWKRLRANRRDYLAMKECGIPFAFFVSILKPLGKLHQYYRK